MLTTSGTGESLERVTTLLDDQGIAYGVALVESYAEPRLQVGSAELVGEAEIAAHLAEIRELAGV
ncbi:hypothetical protein IFU30_12460 [Plantibacter sp. CFBP 8798]|uniref:hypothetical protein n=1 Tax=Plantibacter sp. CFBP 8798 TaxID=2775268 RepID=UPI001784126E|nr:hypothetical protein [Plantibacter sp. CFBP 8798]MBD8467082.1 hypothetical protein [Plantibacter sp. CFBP 8798]